MKHLILTLSFVVLASGCSKRTPEHTGVQINDSLMSISANPIIQGEPVVFTHKLSSERAALLKNALTYRFGSPGVTIQPEGQEPIALWKTEVTAPRVSRKVTVRQGERVLFEREDEVTDETLGSLCSWTTTSEEWRDVNLSFENVEFLVHYWRSYKTPYVGGGHSIASDQVMIPVKRTIR